jgi:hypothetical protein
VALAEGAVVHPIVQASAVVQSSKQMTMYVAGLSDAHADYQSSFPYIRGVLASFMHATNHTLSTYCYLLCMSVRKLWSRVIRDGFRFSKVGSNHLDVEMSHLSVLF